MLATNAALASGGMTNCFFRCGLRMFFLASAQSCCRWRDRRCSVPRPHLPAAQRPPRPPLGRLGTGQRDQFRLGGAIEDARPGRVGRMLACQGGIEGLPRPVAGGSGRPCRRWYPGPSAIWLSLHPSPASEASAFSRMRAFSSCRAGCLPLLDHCVELFTLLVAELHDILLYGNLFRGHEASPSLAETSIQRSTAKSMTWGIGRSGLNRPRRITDQSFVVRTSREGAPLNTGVRRPSAPPTQLAPGGRAGAYSNAYCARSRLASSGRAWPWI